jgi:hypothetical protein
MDLGEKKDQLSLGGILLAGGIGGVFVLFCLLQHNFGGYWWVGGAVWVVGIAIFTACCFLHAYGLHKTGGKVDPGACPTCTRPLPRLGRKARWGACSHCGDQVVNVSAITHGRSRLFVGLKWLLLGLWVLLSPAGFILVIVLAGGLTALLAGMRKGEARVTQEFLTGLLGCLAYFSLGAAAWLFGEAAFRGGRRGRRLLVAVVALLAAVGFGIACAFQFAADEPLLKVARSAVEAF